VLLAAVRSLALSECVAHTIMAIKLDRVQKTDLAARNTLGIQAKVDERELRLIIAA